jgi:hypothetical protein
MTKHEADVIGGLNMTDQISNEVYKQIMIAARDENEVDYVLDKIKAEISEQSKMHMDGDLYIKASCCLKIIDRYRGERSGV